jgi:Tfp pilus assembly protein PilP
MVVMIVVVGCKEAEQKAMNDWLVRDAKQSIAKLKKSLGAPETADSIVECGQMANIAALAKQDKAVADELRQLCTTDIHLAVMNAEVDKIEAKRKARPNDELGIDCMDPFYDFAKQQMREAGTLDAAKPVIARYEAVCPPSAR